jgi:hypothetical protein
MSVTVELSYAEVMIAGMAGVMRQVSGLRNGVQHRDPGHVDPMEAYVSGSIAEWAVCKWLDRFWHPTIGIRAAGDVEGDVGTVEVRSTTRGDGKLIAHDYSFDSRPYLLVLSHEAPRFHIIGWLWGRECKDKSFWRADVPRPAYFIPQARLRPAETLAYEALA